MKTKTLLIIIYLSLFSCNNHNTEYICTPCDLPCDTITFSKPGICPHCNMQLIKKEELMAEEDLTVNEINIENGSGKFLVEGGADTAKTIVVHYHKAVNFSPTSNVIIILPGAGRNGDDYRDAWIEQSEEYGLLVLSLEYSDEHYPGFWSYNLGGIMVDVNIDDLSFKINQNPKDWIYNDFDRIFNMVKSELALTQDTYDMFGHSAGGQILHRLALFKPISKANKILASNSGWYTLPSKNDSFPYGIADLDSNENDFSASLTIFLGEMDNANETRGDLRHTPEADNQGLHRLSRGEYFFETSKGLAEEQKKDFNWKLEIIPNVGHDYREMSNQAAIYLYGSKL